MCTKLGVFFYWTGNQTNNLLSCFGLIDAWMSASDKELPVQVLILMAQLSIVLAGLSGTVWCLSDYLHIQTDWYVHLLVKLLQKYIMINDLNKELPIKNELYVL